MSHDSEQGSKKQWHTKKHTTSPALYIVLESRSYILMQEREGFYRDSMLICIHSGNLNTISFTFRSLALLHRTKGGEQRMLPI